MHYYFLIKLFKTSNINNVKYCQVCRVIFVESKRSSSYWNSCTFRPHLTRSSALQETGNNTVGLSFFLNGVLWPANYENYWNRFACEGSRKPNLWRFWDTQIMTQFPAAHLHLVFPVSSDLVWISSRFLAPKPRFPTWVTMQRDLRFSSFDIGPSTDLWQTDRRTDRMTYTTTARHTSAARAVNMCGFHQSMYQTTS